METKKILTGVPGDPLPDTSLGQYILEKLQKNPLRTIQVDAKTGKTLTNKELLEKSVNLAVALEKKGFKIGDVAAISSENQLNWFVAACATMFLGGCVAPLNPGYVERELQHFFKISKPKIIFVSKKTVSLIQRVTSSLTLLPELIQLDDNVGDNKILTIEEIISSERQNPYCYHSAIIDKPSGQEVVILCSSGTTGLPKGVMLSHRNMLAAIRALSHPDFTSIYRESVILILLPFFHGYGYGTMITTIIENAQAIVMQSFEPKLFCETVQKYQVSMIPLVPPIMVFLAKHPMVSHYDFGSVEEIFCGAAPLSNEIYDAVNNRFENRISIRNGYGMTELSIVTNVSRRFGWKAGTVGPIVPGNFCKVIEIESGKSLGPNQTGEVCFKGDHVMLGYRDDPEATCQTIDTSGWLHTGDLGYYDTDQQLFVVGRLKELIKYKGFQIAPAEIENLLLSHCDVVDAAVVGKEDEICGQIPVAFIVKRQGSCITAEELCKFVDERVSVQKKLRGGVRFIEAIPKNPAGKILRRELEKFFSKL